MTLFVMLDFETLSLQPDAVLLSLGAVAVDRGTGEIRSALQVHLDPAAQPYRRIDASTVLWWMKQGDSARSTLTADKPRGDIAPAAGAFTAFYNSLPDEPEVWSNGAVDHAWLDSLFADAGLKNPVPYWRQRDYRTLKALLPHVKADELEGFVPHDALWDAKWQAAHAVKLFNAMCRGGEA